MQRPEPVDVEFTFEEAGVKGKPIISKTDLKGNITYANKAFTLLSGYSKDELIGKPHNIIRHPDMPKKIFKEMWDTIQKGKEFHGFIKNLRKDGKYYWTEAFVEPIFDDDGNITGYMAARKEVSDLDKKEAIKRYEKMKES